jgi:hypothetical protein
LTIIDEGVPSRQYPPKLWDSSTNMIPATILSRPCFSETFTINSSTNEYGYGSGTYTVYASSYLYNFTTPKKLFDHDLLSDAVWNSNNSYRYNNGIYNKSSINYIKNDYFGEWFIIQLPISIILTKFELHINTYNIDNAPADWRLYGSTDSNTFTEILEARPANRLISSDYNLNIFSKTIPSTFTTPYLYFGFVVNKVIGSTSGIDYTLKFSEFKLFGAEKITTVKSKYLNYYDTSQNITGNMIFSTDSNAIKLNSTSAIANNNIQFQNNINYSGFIGLGGSSVSGNYASNLYIESTNSSIVLNANKTSTSTTPSMILLENGNVGIGTVNGGNYKLDINGNTIVRGEFVATNEIKENNSNLSQIYVKLNNLSNLSVQNFNLKKKFGFNSTINSFPFQFKDTNYFKYDINLSLFTRTLSKTSNANIMNYRIFNIKCFSSDGVFENPRGNINGNLNVLNYDIFMSDNPLTPTGVISDFTANEIKQNTINIVATGTPENLSLDNILPGLISLNRTSDFNYLSIVSKYNNLNISYIIEDYLG